jgi:hypothetical protein
MSFPRLSPTASRVCMALAIFTFACWTLVAATLLTWAPGRAVAMKTAARIADRITSRKHVHSTPRAARPIAFELASSAAGFSYSTGDDSGSDFAWALVDDDGSAWIDTDRRRVETTAKHGPARFWFRDGDEEYTVTDPGIVDEVRRAAGPVRELGREMGVLGGEMGRHGAQIGRLGGRMGALAARLAILESRLARRSASRAERSHAESSVRRMRDELQKLQSELSTHQGEHAGRQQELSRRMSELSARHQEAYQKARTEVREIARKARREGKAGRPHANA